MKDVSGMRCRASVVGGVSLAVALCGLLGVAGCGSSSGGSGGGGTSGPTPLAAGGATDVFVIQTAPQGTDTSILDFSTKPNGSVAPKGSLDVGPLLNVGSVASDSSGRIYVGGIIPSTSTQRQQQIITEYPAGATGLAAPVQTIYTAIEPLAMTVDSGGDIYAAGVELVNEGTIEELLPDGTAKFLMSDSFTSPTGIALDNSGNVYLSVYVSGQTGSPGGAVLMFAQIAFSSTAPLSNTAPLRTIITNGVAYGVALDSTGSIYTCVDVQTNASSTSTTSAAIVEYAGGITGTATPLKTITSSAFSIIGGVQVDSVGNLYLLDAFPSGAGGAATLTPEILGFAESATGDAEPALMLSSSAWTATETGIALH